MNPFKAFVIDQDENRKVVSRMGTLAAAQLDAGEVTIRVHYSSLNYQDALTWFDGEIPAQGHFPFHPLSE